MVPDTIVIDGNNLLHAARKAGGRPAASDFDAERWALARDLDRLTGAIAARVTIVFDGTRGGREEAFRTSSLDVVFSPASEAADTVIERIVCGAPDPGRILVVTSDRMERQMVEARGAAVVSCERFLDDLRHSGDALSARFGRAGAGQPGPCLGDFFPRG
jgi:predicted RNA-binding protein with PIN domain